MLRAQDTSKNKVILKAPKCEDRAMPSKRKQESRDSDPECKTLQKTMFKC